MVGDGPYIGYMGSRAPEIGTSTLLGDTAGSGVPTFALSGNITYRYLRLASASDAGNWAIYLNGINQLSGTINHLPILWAVPSFPVVFTTYADAATRRAASPPLGTTGFQSDDSSYWRRVSWQDGGVTRAYWIRMVEFPASIGTTSIGGDTYNIYEIVRPAAEMLLAYQDGKNDSTATLLGGLYELCFNGNSRHYYSPPDSYDVLFILTPSEPLHYDTIPGRTELNTRVAGEKAIYEDEFVTIDQLEAGDNVTIKYRNQDGSLTGYPTDAAKGFNVVIEAAATGSSLDVVEVDNVTGVPIYTASAVTEIDFVDINTPDLDNLGVPTNSTAYDPVGFDVDSLGVITEVNSPAAGIAEARLAVPHNNLFLSHDDGVGVTQKDPGGYGTINHLRMIDSATVSWTITTGLFEIAPGVYKQGVSIEATAPTPASLTVKKQAVVPYTDYNLGLGDTENDVTLIEFKDTRTRVEIHGSGDPAYPSLPWTTASWENNGAGEEFIKIDARGLPVFAMMDPAGTGTASVGFYVPYNGVSIEDDANHYGMATKWDVNWGTYDYATYPFSSVAINLPSTLRKLWVGTKRSNLAAGRKAVVEDGEVRLTVTTANLPEVGDASDVIPTAIIGVDDRSRGIAAFWRLHPDDGPLYLGPPFPSGLAGFARNGVMCHNFTYIPFDWNVFGANYHDDLVTVGGLPRAGGAGADRWRESTDPWNIIPRKAGIYQFDVIVHLSSLIGPTAVGQLPAGYRSFSRVRLVIDSYSSNGANGNHWKTLQVMDLNEQHPFLAQYGSGQHTLSGHFSIPIGNDQLNPDTETGVVFRVAVEVYYPAGFANGIDRVYSVEEAYLDCRLTETHPRTPHFFYARGAF